MDYLDYGVEDFLCDSSFLKYCLGNNATVAAQWSAWIAEHPQKAKVCERAKRLYFELNGNVTDKAFKEDYKVFRQTFFAHVSKNSIQIKQFANSQHKKAVIKQITIISAIAACLLVFVLLYFGVAKKSQSLTATSNSFITLKGQKRTLTLADGTQIIMNGESIVKIADNYNLSSRNVSLDGEAFFQVTHNAKVPFVVHTARFDIKVLGTTFNVRAYKSDPKNEAALIKGSIKVTINNYSKNTLLLKPKQKFVSETHSEELGSNLKLPAEKFYITDIKESSANHTIAETDWTKNRITFNDENLNNITAELERWYGVTIHFENERYRNYRYTATFENDDIIQVLEILKITNHFNYRKEGNLITIY